MSAQIVRIISGAILAWMTAIWLLAISLPAHATSTIYVVNSTADLPDADPGDGVCAASNGMCTLRAAIMQANYVTGAETITVPSGVYLLTRPGNDDSAILGDLDITDDLTIQGAGSGVTIVDGNGAVTGDRVFQILSTAKETSLSGMTIRNGTKVASAFDEGGGLYWDGGGGHLRLNDVVFESNAARYGGGLYLNYSSSGDTVQMDHVVMHANVATTGAAGGLGVNFGDLATFDLRNSQVYSNTAYEGGGIYFQGTPTFGLLSARVEASEIYSNSAGLSAGIENHSGSASVPLVVLNSHLYNNQASFYGGAIGNYGTLVISNTTMEVNSASTRGGGLYNYEGGQINLAQSTLNGNSAQFGGGIYSEFFLHNNAALTLTNSTLSGNAASRDGGGLYANGGQIDLLNSTIANNQTLVPSGTLYAGMGGGVYITASAIVTAQNTLIGDNTRRYGVNLPEPDDCFASVASLRSLGYNLIETTGNCLISGTTSGNVTGQDPRLGPLGHNFGPTQTQALLLGSPTIDAGQQPFCADAGGAPILTDQRGAARPGGARCDIGAYEYYVQAAQTITFGPLPNKLLGDPPFTVSATASSGLAVTFTAGGPCSVSGNIVTLVNIGSCSITAHQVGDINHAPAPDVGQSFTIGGANSYLPLIVR